MIVLVDLDDTVAGWGELFDLHLMRYTGADRIPRRHERRGWDLNAGRDADERAIISRIMAKPGFYADLRPIPGALRALQEMALEHTVFLVSSPWLSNPTCASDKLAWVERHLGRPWAARTIITSDKTLVHGDVLIDDKPSIIGTRYEPPWTHVVFDAPWNQEECRAEVRLRDWADWREVLVEEPVPLW